MLRKELFLLVVQLVASSSSKGCSSSINRDEGGKLNKIFQTEDPERLNPDSPGRLLGMYECPVSACP